MLSCNHFWCGKEISITYSESVFIALVVQHAMGMCPIVICGLPSCTKCFHMISWTVLFLQNLLNTKCVFSFPLQLFWKKSYSRKNSVRYDKKIYILVSVWRTHFSCQISLKQNFSTDFRKIFKTKISWKSIHWDSSCSMRTDGRTDRWAHWHDEANSRFSQFCNLAQKYSNFSVLLEKNKQS